MAGFIYFDSDVFYRVGETFYNQPLAAELRNRILLSPITFIEVASHLTLRKSGSDVLKLRAALYPPIENTPTAADHARQVMPCVLLDGNGGQPPFP